MTDKITLTKDELKEMLEKEYKRGYVAGLKAAHADKTKPHDALELRFGGEIVKFRGTEAKKSGK